MSNDAVMRTLDQLPRTPQEAGLIEVTFKRKLEMKNSHIRGQLINPNKLFKVLENLSAADNPHYRFYDSPEQFSLRLNENDKIWIHEVQDEFLEEERALDNEVSGKEDDDDEDERDEKDYRENDPARKTQSDAYGKSYMLADMFPEMRHESNYNAINIAPAEGQQPQSMVFDKYWDLLAFPDLHSPDGNYSLDHEREVKLTKQSYFNQTVLNLEQKFAKTPAYVFAAVACIEEQQITRNLSLAGRRGREVVDKDGKRKYKLEDAYDVLDNVKQTPKYFKKGRNEMYGKLDNLGGFQIWFTLSMADLRCVY